MVTVPGRQGHEPPRPQLTAALGDRATSPRPSLPGPERQHRRLPRRGQRKPPGLFLAAEVRTGVGGRSAGSRGAEPAQATCSASAGPSPAGSSPWAGPGDWEEGLVVPRVAAARGGLAGKWAEAWNSQGGAVCTATSQTKQRARAKALGQQKPGAEGGEGEGGRGQWVLQGPEGHRRPRLAPGGRWEPCRAVGEEGSDPGAQRCPLCCRSTGCGGGCRRLREAAGGRGRLHHVRQEAGREDRPRQQVLTASCAVLGVWLRVLNLEPAAPGRDLGGHTAAHSSCPHSPTAGCREGLMVVTEVRAGDGS